MLLLPIFFIIVSRALGTYSSSLTDSRILFVLVLSKLFSPIYQNTLALLLQIDLIRGVKIVENLGGRYLCSSQDYILATIFWYLFAYLVSITPLVLSIRWSWRVCSNLTSKLLQFRQSQRVGRPLQIDIALFSFDNLYQYIYLIKNQLYSISILLQDLYSLYYELLIQNQGFQTDIVHRSTSMSTQIEFGFLASVWPASVREISQGPSPKGWKTQTLHSDPSYMLTRWNQKNFPATTCSKTLTILYSGVPSWPSFSAKAEAWRVTISLWSQVIQTSWNPPIMSNIFQIIELRQIQ